MSAEVAYRTEAQLGEGAIWHPDRGSLFWVDIEKRTLYEFMPEKKKCRSWQFDRKVTTVVPETDHTVIVALERSKRSPPSTPRAVGCAATTANARLTVGCGWAR